MKLPAQWNNLDESEKLIIIIGSAVALVLLLYILLIGPFFSALSDLQDQVHTKRDLLSWLQPTAQKIQQYSSKGYLAQPPVAGDLADKINASLQAHQLKSFMTQLTPVNAQQVAIDFQTVPFDAAMDWLTALWLTTDLQIKQATITPLKTAGLVSLQLVLMAA